MRKVSTARKSCSYIDAGAGKVSLEGPAVIWRGDHDRHAAVLDDGEKILTYPLGKFLLVTVKQPSSPGGGRILEKIRGLGAAP